MDWHISTWIFGKTFQVRLIGETSHIMLVLLSQLKTLSSKYWRITKVLKQGSDFTGFVFKKDSSGYIVDKPENACGKSRQELMRTWVRAVVQFSSVAQSCPTLCDPMNRSTPGLPVPHQLPEFTQIHVHQVSDAIQPSHPLSSPSPAPNPSQHQGLFQRVNSSHEMAKVL